MGIYYYYSVGERWILINQINNEALDQIFKRGTGYTRLPEFGNVFLDFINMNFIYNNVNYNIARLNYQLA